MTVAMLSLEQRRAGLKAIADEYGVGYFPGSPGVQRDPEQATTMTRKRLLGESHGSMAAGTEPMTITIYGASDDCVEVEDAGFRVTDLPSELAALIVVNP